ncbi:MAG: CbtB domain-containing protein [Methylococcales bacterium]
MSLNSDLFETTTVRSGSSTWRDTVLPAMLVAVIAGMLLFFTGFSETSVLHNAAHDGRHAAGFPCH